MISRHLNSPQTAVPPVHRQRFNSPISKSCVPPELPSFPGEVHPRLAGVRRAVLGGGLADRRPVVAKARALLRRGVWRRKQSGRQRGSGTPCSQQQMRPPQEKAAEPYNQAATAGPVAALNSGSRYGGVRCGAGRAARRSRISASSFTSAGISGAGAASTFSSSLRRRRFMPRTTRNRIKAMIAKFRVMVMKLPRRRPRPASWRRRGWARRRLRTAE